MMQTFGSGAEPFRGLWDERGRSTGERQHEPRRRLRDRLERHIAALLTGLPGWQEAKTTVRLLLDRLSGRYFAGDEEIVLSTSVGVALAPAHVARRMRRAVGLPDRPGLLIQAVERDSPAARAGLREGDLLVAASGRELHSVAQLQVALTRAKRTLTLDAVRGVDQVRLNVRLA